MIARAVRRHLGIAVLLLLAGCSRWQNVALGPGGRPVVQVREGTPVELAFAAPRRLQGFPQPVARLHGTVERARGDTLHVRVEAAAALGGELRAAERRTVAAVIVDRDVAVRLRERSGRSTALLVAGVAAIVAIVLLAG